MIETFDVNCKRQMDKAVNSSKKLSGNRVQPYKPWTLLNECIFQLHSFHMWEHPQEHETSIRVVICIELLFYIKNISSPNKGEKMQKGKNVSKYTVTQQKSACCMTATFMV